MSSWTDKPELSRLEITALITFLTNSLRQDRQGKGIMAPQDRRLLESALAKLERVR